MVDTEKQLGQAELGKRPPSRSEALVPRAEESATQLAMKLLSYPPVEYTQYASEIIRELGKLIDAGRIAIEDQPELLNLIKYLSSSEFLHAYLEEGKFYDRLERVKLRINGKGDNYHHICDILSKRITIKLHSPLFAKVLKDTLGETEVLRHLPSEKKNDDATILQLLDQPIASVGLLKVASLIIGRASPEDRALIAGMALPEQAEDVLKAMSAAKEAFKPSLTQASGRPQLSETDLAEFRAYAEAHQWESRSGIAPSMHITTHFTKWLGRGLMREHIKAVQPSLASAYSTEISRNPRNRVAGLRTRQHTRHSESDESATPLKVSSHRWVPSSDLTPEENTARRAQEAKRRRTYRSKKHQGLS